VSVATATAATRPTPFEIDPAPFFRRLSRGGDAALIVAYSGGGDSLALLLAARDWARTAGRRIIAVTVDHGLQAAGAAWARACAARCAELGVTHETLRWTGAKPATGIPAAARAVRHALIADFARARGAAVILMGHTADDSLEAQRMRASGSSTPTPREWGPSPAWPQGRCVFLHRPLLACRRSDLRVWLRDRGETWIEDPANQDSRYARARARQTLDGDTVGLVAETRRPMPTDSAPMAGAAGELVFPLHAFAEGGADERHALSCALLATSGRQRPASHSGVDALLERLRYGVAFTASLGGARIAPSAEHIVITREAGEFQRSAAAPLDLPVGATVVWDGRFEIVALAPGLSVRPLAGLASRLEKAEKMALKTVPVGARGALPAIVDAVGGVTCPILAGEGKVRAVPLVGARFLGACGAIQHEAAIWRVAKSPWAS
jgi:tRNA(Ile)-lysidine synthase